MTDYKTVDGHSVARDGEYETRSGRKATIVGFRDGATFPIIGYIEKSGISTWSSSGMVGQMGELQSDLMRPWKDKPDAEGCKGCVLCVETMKNPYTVSVTCGSCGKYYGRKPVKEPPQEKNPHRRNRVL